MAGEASSLREILASFTFQVDTSQLKAARKQLVLLREAAKNVGTALKSVQKSMTPPAPKTSSGGGGQNVPGLFSPGGGMFAIRSYMKVAAGAAILGYATKKIFDFADANREAALEVHNLSNVLGLSHEQTQKYQYVEKALGLGEGGLTFLMSRFQRSIGMAAQKPAGTLAKTFKEMGVDISDGAGGLREWQDILMETLEKAGSKGHEIEIQRLTALMGRGGARAMAAVAKGPGGIQALLGEAGPGRTEEQIEGAIELTHALAKLSQAWIHLKSTIAAPLQKAIMWIVGGMEKLIKLMNGAAAGQTILIMLTAAFVGLGIAAAAAMWSILAPLLAVSAALLGLYLILEDIVGFFTGKDSLIGELIDKWFGPGSQEKVRSWFKRIGDDIDMVYDKLGGFMGALKSVKEFLYPSDNPEDGTLAQFGKSAVRTLTAAGGVAGAMALGQPAIAAGIATAHIGSEYLSPHITNNVTVTAQPGEDGNALAGRIGQVCSEHTSNAIQEAAKNYSQAPQ